MEQQELCETLLFISFFFFTVTEQQAGDSTNVMDVGKYRTNLMEVNTNLVNFFFKLKIFYHFEVNIQYIPNQNVIS